MAIELKLESDGLVITCATVEEAAELIQKLREPAKKPPRQRLRLESHGNGCGADTPSAPGLPQIVAELSKEAQKLLDVLAKESPLTTDELSDKTGVQPEDLKYRLRNIQAALRKAGIDPDGFIQREPVSVDGQPKSRYSLSKEARAMLSQKE